MDMNKSQYVSGGAPHSLSRAVKQSITRHPTERLSCEDGLSPRAAVDHLGDRRTSLRHRHDSAFLRLDFFTDDELRHGFHLFKRAHDGAAHADLLDKDAKQIGFRCTAGRHPVDHHDAAACDRPQAVRPGHGPDVVDDCPARRGN